MRPALWYGAYIIMYTVPPLGRFIAKRLYGQAFWSRLGIPPGHEGKYVGDVSNSHAK